MNQDQFKDQLLALRHSAEHVLHQAMKELFPSIQLAMGPATDEGYYFDFDGSVAGQEAVIITSADFGKIEKRMADKLDRDSFLEQRRKLWEERFEQIWGMSAK